MKAAASLRLDILVVDNASADDSIAVLTRHVPDVRILQTGSNLGFAAGNNRGAAALMARGCDYLLFLNPDAHVLPNTIQVFVDALDSDETAGCVGSASFDSSGRTVAGTIPRFRARQILAPMFSAQMLRAVIPAWLAMKPAASRTENHAVCGACVMFRTEAFRDIGGFDEGTFLYREEYIVAERMRPRGRTVLSLPQPMYHHPGGVCTDLIPLRRKLHFINSEQHLLKEYLRWPWIGRQVLRLVRYLDFSLFAACYLLAPGIAGKSGRPREHRPRQLRDHPRQNS